MVGVGVGKLLRGGKRAVEVLGGGWRGGFRGMLGILILRWGVLAMVRGFRRRFRLMGGLDLKRWLGGAGCRVLGGTMS